MNKKASGTDDHSISRRDLIAGAAAGIATQSLSSGKLKSEELTTATELITGSHRGIGLELARNYAQRGWRVVGTARRPEAADDLQAIAADHPNLQIERLDLLDHAMIDSLAEKLSDLPIDVLLNNAAILGEPNDQNFGSLDV